MNQDEKRRLTSKKVYGPLLEKNLHSSLRRELIENFGFENLIPVADLLIERFLKIIEEFTCEKELLNPYQTMVVGVDKHEKLRKTHLKCKLKGRYSHPDHFRGDESFS